MYGTAEATGAHPHVLRHGDMGAWDGVCVLKGGGLKQKGRLHDCEASYLKMPKYFVNSRRCSNDVFSQICSVPIGPNLTLELQ